MVRTKETAEEQLLRMIEGPKGPVSSSGPLRHFAPERLRERLRGRLELLRRWALPMEQSGAGSDGILWRLHLAERVCWIVLASLGLYLVADLLFMNRRPPTIVLQTRPSAGTASDGVVVGALAEDRLKPLADYRQALLTRNPFGLSTPAIVKSQGAKSRLGELMATLTVVGINRGRVPEALIEDTTAKRTSVVKVGDQINGVTVKFIDQRGVVVMYQNEEALLP